jgi:hypothetical protein
LQVRLRFPSVRAAPDCSVAEQTDGRPGELIGESNEMAQELLPGRRLGGLSRTFLV